MSDLEKFMHRSGGVMKMTVLQAAGHSRHRLRRALEEGRIVQLRRNRGALPHEVA